MKFTENIKEKEYEEFVKNNPKSHFMQSYYWGNVSKYKHFIPHYVGLKEDGKLVATALLLEKKMILGYSYYYCPRGYIIDYKNKELLKYFTYELTKYAKKNKSIFIKIDPDIKYHEQTPEGVINKEVNNYDIFNTLIDLGYKHTGFNTEFTNEQPRFTFRLNLNRPWDEIYSGIHATTRKILNKGNQYNLDIYVGDKKDINDFYKTMEETALREDLGCNPIEYYENFYKILHKEDMSDLYVVKLDVDKLRETYKNKIADLTNKEEETKNNTKQNESKKENKLKELATEKNKALKDLDYINTIDEKEIVLSSIMTVKYADKVWTIHGGNSTLLRNLNSNYLCYYAIIKDAYDNGYKTIDFFGCSGNPNPSKDSSIYGLHNFKKRLGGEYTEFIGEFDLITNKLMYRAFKILIPIRRKITKMRLRRR